MIMVCHLVLNQMNVPGNDATIEVVMKEPSIVASLSFIFFLMPIVVAVSHQTSLTKRWQVDIPFSRNHEESVHFQRSTRFDPQSNET